MRCIVFATMEHGRQKQPGAIHSFNQRMMGELTVVVEGIGARQLATGTLDVDGGTRRRLWDVRLQQIYQFDMRLRGFEAVDGVSYAQEWYCEMLLIVDSPLGQARTALRPFDWCPEVAAASDTGG